MSDLKDIKLVSGDRSKGDFIRGGMTISFDSGGNPETITRNTAVEQDIIKSIFTGPQPDGYGSVIFQVVGEKNIGVVKGIITYTVITALQVLVRLHRQINLKFPLQFRGIRKLTSVEFIFIEDVTPTSILVTTSFRTGAGADLQNLQVYVGAKN